MKLIGVPGINGLLHTKGSEKAPKEIIKTLKEIYSKEDLVPLNLSKLKLESFDYDSKDPEKSNNLLYEFSYKLFKEKEVPFFLGGDHSVSYSLVRAFLDYCEGGGKSPCLIVFDAHPDMMEPVDSKFPTHEEWLRGLIDSGFPCDSILLVGSRNADEHEIKYLKEKKIKMVSVDRFVEDCESTVDLITEFANGRDLYVSIDLDSVDPVFSPGTYYQEPGGFTSREFLYMIKRISKIKSLKAVDLVEVIPKKDRDNLTVKLAARIVSEFY
jgi:arginase family enzyme